MLPHFTEELKLRKEQGCILIKVPCQQQQYFKRVKDKDLLQMGKWDPTEGRPLAQAPIKDTPPQVVGEKAGCELGSLIPLHLSITKQSLLVHPMLLALRRGLLGSPQLPDLLLKLHDRDLFPPGPGKRRQVLGLQVTQGTWPGPSPSSGSCAPQC